MVDLVISLLSCGVWRFGVLQPSLYGDLKLDMIADEARKWFFPMPQKLYLSRQVPSLLLLMTYASLSLHLDASGAHSSDITSTHTFSQ
ncbi:hypothetical protein AB2843_000345 [Klebsiella pneumoniae]|nr:hypothetical protein [Klebsiella pneumoniae]